MPIPAFDATETTIHQPIGARRYPDERLSFCFAVQCLSVMGWGGVQREGTSMNEKSHVAG